MESRGFRKGRQREGSSECSKCPGNQIMPSAASHPPSSVSSRWQQAPPSFTSIPLEIRRKVYEYLLSDDYVLTYTSELHMESKYDTALFTVCKRISDEALEFFYTTNAFIAVESNMGYFLRKCPKAMPIVTREEPDIRTVPNCALKIYHLSAIDTFHDGTHPSRKFSSAVFPGRHLATFLQLLNTEVWCFTRPPLPTHALNAEFRTNRGYFKSNGWATSFLADGLKVLRKPKNFAGDYVFKISGDLTITAEEINSIRAAMPPSDISRDEAVELMKKAKQRGDEFLQTGDYNAARAEYIIANKGTNNLILRAKGWEPKEPFDVDSININISISTSIIDSKQGHYTSAIENARTAWRVVRMWKRHSSELRATCKIRLGEALAENGQYRSAATAFERALAWSPGNEAVKEKLDAAKLAVYDSVYDVMESGLKIFERPDSSGTL
jgi:tetratricopeptide (TPR) repeat protein